MGVLGFNMLVRTKWNHSNIEMSADNCNTILSIRDYLFFGRKVL